MVKLAKHIPQWSCSFNIYLYVTSETTISSFFSFYSCVTFLLKNLYLYTVSSNFVYI